LILKSRTNKLPFAVPNYPKSGSMFPGEFTRKWVNSIQIHTVIIMPEQTCEKTENGRNLFEWIFCCHSKRL